MTKVFIDGSAGTTGLRIFDRLGNRDDIQLITLSEDLRKDVFARRESLNSADIAFLCLPDAAAIEACELVESDSSTVIIDTSTAHRVSSGWIYGFPEIANRREKIKNSKRIANPGCHASGFVALIAPLVDMGLVDKSVMLSATSLTGYSGGGKKMISDYENPENEEMLKAPRQYGISQTHKHLPEMSVICGLEKEPAFLPIVAPYYSGMEVTIPLFGEWVNGGLNDVKSAYINYYKDGLVKYVDSSDENGFLSASTFSGRDDMQISVFGNEDRMILVSRFDNLGKGASGSAIQNMNIVLGLPDDYGLNV